ncbi:MAG: purine-nucleoside phosphorylase [Balneolaceae bacterium]|nr:purine-nucleoside phosphorylase [Balneolaceae bacterium]
MPLPDYLDDTISFLSGRGVPESPRAVIILGSGLGGFAGRIQKNSAIPYSTIPHFPATSVQGHDGTLISGTIGDNSIIAFSGRFHHYEGYSFEQTVLPVYLTKALQAEQLIISNAAGAINTSFSVGDLMVIEDIIRQNMTITPQGYKQFRYTHHRRVPEIRKLASDLGITTQFGTYIYAKGPNYETKAEIRAYRIMGADAVGMSTAPELMEAARLGIKTAAISMISNMAAGVTDGKLNHEEVSKAAELRKEDFAKLVTALIEHL